MGEVQEWQRDAVIRVGEQPFSCPYILKVAASDSETDVLESIFDPGVSHILAPNTGRARENTIIAHNLKRMLSRTKVPPPPIIVPVAGEVPRERVELFEWLIENDYVPGILRWGNTDKRLVPRHMLLNEVMPVIEAVGEWAYACLDWKFGTTTSSEYAVRARLKTLPGTWEIIE